MKLDLVHDIQIAYRKVVDSMSRPGLISDLKDQAVKVELDMECFHSTIVMAMMLLDTEVTFKVVSANEEPVTRRINQLTYAKAAETEQADYIFILNDAHISQIERTFKEAKIGTLVDPNQSATIMMEVDGLNDGMPYQLRGPGIEKESHVKVDARGNWMEIRQDKNDEYPMGIDVIFMDPFHHVLCLPRTTQIMKQVVE